MVSSGNVHRFRGSLIAALVVHAHKLEAMSGVAYQHVRLFLTESDAVSLCTCLSAPPSVSCYLKGRKTPLTEAKLEALTRIANTQYSLLLSPPGWDSVGRTALRADMNAVLDRVFNEALHRQLSNWMALMLPDAVRPVPATSIPTPAQSAAVAVTQMAGPSTGKGP